MNDTEKSGTGAALDKYDDSAPLKESSRSSRLRIRLRNIGAVIASVAAVGAAIGGLTGYWNAWKVLRTEVFHETQTLQQNAASQPNIVPRLSLIVLPFANLNNDPEQDYFGDGITTDLITDLGQMPGAFVIGRGTAFAYKNKHIDLRTVGKELAIRWAVQGAVQRSGDHVRINVFLTDLSTGGDFWSDRFDGDRSNLAGLQDQIVARLARSLSIELIEAEDRRSQSERSSNPDAVDFAMRGWSKFYQPRTQDRVREANEFFDNALRLDSDSVSALVGKSWCLVLNMFNQWSASVETDKKYSVELIDRALAKQPFGALAHTVKGETIRFGNPEAAIAEYDAALQIDPNYSPAYLLKGAALILSGRARESFSQVQIALRLSPKDPFAFQHALSSLSRPFAPSRVCRSY
jgi:TolB-like protein